MSEIKVSLFASAIRFQFYPVFIKSLQSTTEKYEVVFAGHNTPEELIKFLGGYPYTVYENIENKSLKTIIDLGNNCEFKYIHTGRIKPSQCYEIARRNCEGETIQWTADDAEMTPDFIGKAYRYWKERNNEKLILSLQTVENGQYCDMKVHSFFGCQFHTPLMAPLALMSRKFMQDLGGFDRRYVCGQYENTAVMEAIVAGGHVEIFGDKENHIILDHYRRHGIVRPFATGYNHDRSILESSWTNGSGKVSLTRNDKHEPYEDKDILIKSQSHKGQWE
jgi:hypothetical protein